RLPQCQAAIAVAQVILWLGPGAAWGQDAPASQPAAPESQPADFGPPPPPERGAFTLSVTDLYIGMEMDYLATRNRSSQGIRGEIVQKNRDLRVIELFGVGMSGDIGDPNLFDYRANLEFGLTQSRFEEDVESFSHTDSDNG